MGAEGAVLGREAQTLALGQELFVQRHRQIRTGGSQEVGPSAVAAIRSDWVA